MDTATLSKDATLGQDTTAVLDDRLQGDKYEALLSQMTNAMQRSYTDGIRPGRILWSASEDGELAVNVGKHQSERFYARNHGLSPEQLVKLAEQAENRALYN